MMRDEQKKGRKLCKSEKNRRMTIAIVIRITTKKAITMTITKQNKTVTTITVTVETTIKLERRDVTIIIPRT